MTITSEKKCPFKKPTTNESPKSCPFKDEEELTPVGDDYEPSEYEECPEAFSEKVNKATDACGYVEQKHLD